MSIATEETLAGFAIRDTGRIRHLVLNRPEVRNALNRAMRRQFSIILDEAASDDRVGAVVLSGGGRAFCAGVDLNDRPAGAKPVEPNPAQALRMFPKPVIAAIDGPRVTGALEMILSCDFAIASRRARFVDTHARNGLFPRWGGGTLLVDAIGVRRTRQMMLSGEFIDAPTACSWGIVNEIVPAHLLIARAQTIASAMIDTASKQPLAYGLAARMLDQMAQQEMRRTIENEHLAAFDRAIADQPDPATSGKEI